MLKTDNSSQPGASTRGSSNRAFELNMEDLTLSANPNNEHYSNDRSSISVPAQPREIRNRGEKANSITSRDVTIDLSINPQSTTAASLQNKNLKEKVQEKPVKYLCRAVTAGLVVLLLGFGLYIGFKAFKRKKVPDNKHNNTSSTPYTPLLRAPQPEEQGEKCDDELCQQLYYLLGPIGMLCITLVIQYVDKISGYKLSSTVGRKIRRSPKIENLEEDSSLPNPSGATEPPATELSLNPPSTSAAQELVQPRLEFKNQSTKL